MNTLRPYLRVVAGFFAGLCIWLAIVTAIQVDFGQVIVFLVFAVGLGYLALAKPIRQHIARVKAENAATIARADAANAAFLAGDTKAALAPPPPDTTSRPVRKGVVIAVIAAAVFLVFGIVADISDGLEQPADDQSPAPSTQSIPTSAARTTTAVPSQTPATAPATTSAQATTAQTSSAVPQSASAAPALMPAVLCMNLQAAQDIIQAAGVFYSRSEDATGKGRMQISDRNWVVVAQSPAPGTPIGEGDAVLSVVKYGEPGDCS